MSAAAKSASSASASSSSSATASSGPSHVSDLPQIVPRAVRQAFLTAYYDVKRPHIWLFGEAGSGKSTIMCHAADELIGREHAMIYSPTNTDLYDLAEVRECVRRGVHWGMFFDLRWDGKLHPPVTKQQIMDEDSKLLLSVARHGLPAPIHIPRKWNTPLLAQNPFQQHDMRFMIATAHTPPAEIVASPHWRCVHTYRRM